MCTSSLPAASAPRAKPTKRSLYQYRQSTLFPLNCGRPVLVAINHVQLTAKGEVARFNIGEHTFTTRSGGKHTAVVTFVDGPPFVTVATAEDRHDVQLRRCQNKRRLNADGTYTHYGIWAYPDEPIVPAHLRGATTLIRFSSTDDEIASRCVPRARHPQPGGDGPKRGAKLVPQVG